MVFIEVIFNIEIYLNLRFCMEILFRLAEANNLYYPILYYLNLQILSLIIHQ